MLKYSALFFALGLSFMLLSLGSQLPFAETPMRIGETVLQQGLEQTGSSNLVTAVVLAFRGLDTLGELAILFSAAMAASLVLGQQRTRTLATAASPIVSAGITYLTPVLMLIGAYIIVHGHISPGGGFQGGVILAAAFFLPRLSGSESDPETKLSIIESLAGTVFIGIGLLAWLQHGAFLQPLWNPGEPGQLLSAGSLPWLYLAVGLKVGAELSGLLLKLSMQEADPYA